MKIEKQHIFIIFDEQTLIPLFLYLKNILLLNSLFKCCCSGYHGLQNQNSVNVRRHLLESFQKIFISYSLLNIVILIHEKLK